MNNLEKMQGLLAKLKVPAKQQTEPVVFIPISHSATTLVCFHGFFVLSEHCVPYTCNHFPNKAGRIFFLALDQFAKRCGLWGLEGIQPASTSVQDDKTGVIRGAQRIAHSHRHGPDCGLPSGTLSDKCFSVDLGDIILGIGNEADQHRSQACYKTSHFTLNNTASPKRFSTIGFCLPLVSSATFLLMKVSSSLIVISPSEFLAAPFRPARMACVKAPF